MLTVSAYVVAVDVILIESRPCFFVDLARDTEDAGVEVLADEEYVLEFAFFKDIM